MKYFMEKDDKLYKLPEEERKKIIYNLTEVEREKYIRTIVEKLSVNSKKKENEKSRNTKWKDKEFVKKVILEYVKYLTVNRNKDNTSAKAIITEKQAFEHLEKTFNFRSKPNLEKTKRILELLDKNIDSDSANIILMKFGKIVDESEEKLQNKLDILKEFDYLEAAIDIPRKLAISPDYLYARLNYFTQMLKKQNPSAELKELKVSEVLSDKDPFTEGNKKRITMSRKVMIIEKYGKKGEEANGRRSFTNDAEVFRN